jgi:hypothetical protein
MSKTFDLATGCRDASLWAVSAGRKSSFDRGALVSLMNAGSGTSIGIRSWSRLYRTERAIEAHSYGATCRKRIASRKSEKIRLIQMNVSIRQMEKRKIPFVIAVYAFVISFFDNAIDPLECLEVDQIRTIQSVYTIFSACVQSSTLYPTGQAPYDYTPIPLFYGLMNWYGIGIRRIETFRSPHDSRVCTGSELRVVAFFINDGYRFCGYLLTKELLEIRIMRDEFSHANDLRHLEAALRKRVQLHWTRSIVNKFNG